MGGATKKPISSMEKRQKKLQEEAQKKAQKKISKTGKEVTSKNIVIDKETIAKVQEELKKEKIVTPYTLASKIGVTMSVAKKILEELQKQGMISQAAKNRRTVVYVTSS